MDSSNMKRIIEKICKKYRYVVLIVVLGVALMMIPFGEKEAEDTTLKIAVEPAISVEERLRTILSQINGVGNVDVMLQELTGEEYVYQTDEDTVTSDSSTSVKEKTITVSDNERNNTGLVCQIKPPTYQGAIVICQGGDDPKVRLNVAEAVSKVTGLGMDRIAVLKMK